MPYEYNPNIPYPVILPCGHHQKCSPEYSSKQAKPSSRPRSRTIERGNSRDYTSPAKPTSSAKAGTSPATAIPLCCSTHPLSPEEGAYHSYQSPTDDFAEVFAGCSSKHGPKLKERQNSRMKQGCTNSSCADEECYDCIPRRPASKQQCIDARIPSTHETSQWDPSISRPLTLRTYVFDCISIGRYIHEWAKLSKNENIIETSRRLRGGLRNLATSVNGLEVFMDAQKKSKKKKHSCSDHACSNCSDSGIGSEGGSGIGQIELDVSTAKYFVKRGNAMLDRFEGLLADTTKKMAASVENVRGMELVSFLFDEEIDRTQTLVKDLDIWKTRFDANCGTIIANS